MVLILLIVLVGAVFVLYNNYPDFFQQKVVIEYGAMCNETYVGGQLIGDNCNEYKLDDINTYKPIDLDNLVVN